jgi:hypothetical protein
MCRRSFEKKIIAFFCVFVSSEKVEKNYAKRHTTHTFFANLVDSAPAAVNTLRASCSIG